MRKRWFVWAPLAMVGFALFITLGGAVVRQLWNWLLPPLFGWPALTFWQALALLALCRILFGGVGMGGSRRGVRGRIRDRVDGRVRERMTERWNDMTPEERERIRQKIRHRFGVDPFGGEAAAPGDGSGEPHWR